VVTDKAGTPHATAAPTGYGPAELRGAYELPANSPVPQTIALVAAYDNPTIEADLAVYSETYGLPPCTTANGCFRKVNQDGEEGPYPKTDTGWALEIAMDVQIAHAICQNCDILLVEADSNLFSDLRVAVETAADLGATQISNSYGAGEFAGAATDTAYDQPGIAVTVSSGDFGHSAEYPASSPYVVAVGGTTLQVDPGNTYGGETVWSGAGSGCSAYFSAQPWQTGDPKWGATGCGTQRGIADVAAVADPATGASVYDTTKYKGESGWFKLGGTSLSAPLIAGVYALAGGGAAEYPAAYPYEHQEDSPASLHDVTSGSNGSCGGTTICKGAPGYDGPTGVGTPKGIVAFGAAAGGEPNPLTLNINEGEGTVVSDPAGLECTGAAPTTCEGEFEEGAEVTLTASPAAGYRHFRWDNCPSGNLGTRQCTVTMSEAKEVGVKFRKAWNLGLSKTGDGVGTIKNTSNGLTCPTSCTETNLFLFEGQEITVFANAPGKNQFVEFSGGTGPAAACDGQVECTYTVEADASTEAVINKYAKATLSLSKEGGGETRITGAMFCNNSCTAISGEFYTGPTPEEVTIGWDLKNGTNSIEWTSGAGTCTGSSSEDTGSCTVTMDEAHALVAKLE
jgi:hypothetical protein